MAEEVEVGSVEMGGDVEAFSALAGAGPTVFDAREALAVEVDGAFGDGLSLEEFCVEPRDGDEEDDGSQKPSS